MWYPFPMRILPLLCAAALLSVPAKADKFWLGDPGKQSVKGGSPDVIEGVLIDENATSYHIRVVGGEIVLPKKRVFKIEKDGLTLEKIVEAEKKETARLKKAAERRALERTAERLRREVAEAEAATERHVEREHEEREVHHGHDEHVVVTPGFDPVIGRVSPVYGYYSHQQLLAELTLAWTLTKDRRYLKALRRLRRLH